MPFQRNVESKKLLMQDVKILRNHCEDACNIIENAPPDSYNPLENDTEKALCYVEGVRSDIHNSTTPISIDENLLTIQFLDEIKEKTAQVEELAAFTRGLIRDKDFEIERLKNLVQIAHEAKSRPVANKHEILPDHLLRARSKFQLLKSELQGLLTSLFPSNDEEMKGALGLTVSVTMTYINITSVKLFVRVQNVFGVCKVLACLIVIGGGVYEISKGNTENLQKGFEGSTTSPGGIALALYSGLWAYDGWNSVTVVTEEIINPGVNVPLSIAIAVPLITGLYVFMNVAYMTVLSYAEMTSGSAVAVAFGTRVLGPASFLIPLGVAIATFGCAMSVQFGVTRVCYTAARGGHMLEVFSYVNMKRLTPAPAVAFQALLTLIFISVGNIKTLIEFASWFLWFFYGLAMVALLVLRRTHAHKPRPYRVPTIVPCFVLLVAIFLSVLPIVHDPSVKYLMAVGFIVIGVAVYTLFVYYKKTPTALLSKITFLTQVLFESVPPNTRQD